jgi:hypothetical protein
MQTAQRLILVAGLVAGSGPVLADTANGPDPYAAGFGFDRPHEASWGGWIRGDAGTLYAEWDTFSDASYGTGGDRSAAPTLGQSGTTDAYLSWNAGTFVSDSGNLYNFSTAESFQANLAGAAGGTPLRVALQTEGWGTAIDPASVTLNGVAPTFSATTYTDPAFNSSFGTVELIQRLYYWDLASAPASYQLAFGTAGPHLALAQVAVDIGPAAAPVPLPAAAWLFGSALSGLALIGRRKDRPAAA